MKTLIVYTSKHGSTMKVAKKIATRVSNFELVDLAKKEAIDFEQYDVIYVGTPIYYAGINTLVKKFLKRNKSILLEKELKIFTLGLDDKNIDKTIAKAFDTELLAHAHYVHIGGAYEFEQMSFFERFIVKKVARFSESVSMIDEDKIIELTDSKK